jgi:hypothetical protein
MTNLLSASLPDLKTTLKQLMAQPKCGDESFHDNDDALGFCLKDFWAWNVSDLLSNATRGRLAEFIVAKAVGATEVVRDEWAAHDLTTKNGLKIEVKSAAYLQSWKQENYSAIQFKVAKAKAFATRCADIYVFALLDHKDKRTVDPLNVKQWKFYVLKASALNERTRSQHSITLKSLAALAGDPVNYFNLSSKIKTLLFPVTG